MLRCWHASATFTLRVLWPQVRLLEVEPSLADRLRSYLPPAADAEPPAAPPPAAAAPATAAEQLGAAVIPLAALVAVANKPVQAIWPLRDAAGGAMGDVALEASWLPACVSPS